MTISNELLNKAQAAGTRLTEAERQAQLARAEYHAIVRRMHLAGGSLREIAEALGLSHQRVQQMVDGAGGSWWQRVWRSRRARRGMVCTFCRRPDREVAKLIAGPKVYICDACIALAEKARTGRSASAARGSLTLAGEGGRARCSFCSKRSTVERTLLTGPAGNVCSECLDVCQQILSDSAG